MKITMNDSNGLWLGDEQSFLDFLEIEKKIHHTPASELHQLAESVTIKAFEESSSSEFGDMDYMVSRAAGNVAIIDVKGSMVAANRPINRLVGLTSYEEIRNAVFEAKEAEGIDAIVLNMNTPGGQAAGVSELGDFLREVNAHYKPIYTYAGTTMASAGYWLGSVGREIYGAKLATIGSIGVISMHADYSKMYEDEGIKITVLRSGEFKALGSPYEKLDEKARNQIQTQMDAIYGVFLQDVAENRGTSVEALKESAAEGRVFVGEEAVSVGLADHITSFDSAINAVSNAAGRSSNSAPLLPTEMTTGNLSMAKKKVLTEAGQAALSNGVPEAELLDNPEMFTEVEEDQIEETTEGEEAAAEEGSEGAEESTEGAEGSDADSADGGPEANSGVQSVNASALDSLLNRIDGLTTDLAEARAELKAKSTEAELASAQVEPLKKIAITAINRMQVGLGQQMTKLDDFGVDAVLQQYNSTFGQFNQRFKVGAQASVPEEGDVDGDLPQATNSSLEAGVTRLTDQKLGGSKR